MKKALAILLAFSMLLSLTACGGKTAPASVSSESEQSTDSVEDAAKAESEAAVQNQDTDVNEPAADTKAAAAEETEQAAQNAASSETAAAADQAVQSAASSETAAQAAADPAPSAEAQSPVGSYKLTGHSGNLEEEMNDIINIVRLGGSLYLTLKEDGTGSINLLRRSFPWNGMAATSSFSPEKGLISQILSGFPMPVKAKP